VAIQFNHTIVDAVDREEEATFFTEVMGLAPAHPFGHFLVADLAHDASLDFVQGEPGDVLARHYAFLVSEDEFTEIHDRIVERDVDHWADPSRRRPGEINHNDGGRGVYFAGPSGHLYEIITRPYGSGSS
jgi:extradiol dioxygenase family protein